MQKIFAAVFLAAVLLIGGNVNAQDVYVGSSNVAGRDCYLMTETIREYDTARYHVKAKVKLVRRSDSNVQYVDYTFTDGGGESPGLWFQNSQNFHAMLSSSETPLEWKMYQLIQSHLKGASADNGADKIFAYRWFDVDFYVLPKTIRKNNKGFSVDVIRVADDRKLGTHTFIFFNNGNINEPEDKVRFTEAGRATPGGLDNVLDLRSDFLAKAIYRTCKKIL